MVEFASIEIILGAVALVAVILFAIGCVVCCCGKAGGGDPAKEPDAAVGRRQGLLNKEAAGAGAGKKIAAWRQVKREEDEEQLCAICRGALAEPGAGPCRRLRACGHVYHKECVELWLQRKAVCPLCRAKVGGRRAR